MVQQIPLPLTVSCFSKIQIGFTFLVPAHLGSPGQRAVKRVCVWYSDEIEGTRDRQLLVYGSTFTVRHADAEGHASPCPAWCAMPPAMLQLCGHYTKWSFACQDTSPPRLAHLHSPSESYYIYYHRRRPKLFPTHPVLSSSCTKPQAGKRR